MPTSHLTLASLPHISEAKIISSSSINLSLPQPPKRFFRHGWQSWALTTWLDPSGPPLPIRPGELRSKDEDPAYSFAKNHVSAWVGAVELAQDDILLLGALNLGGRVELDGTTLNGFYESQGRDGDLVGEWLLARGREDQVFARYVGQLAGRLDKGRFEQAPRVWCSWYSLYRWINEHILLKALEDLADLPFDVFQLDDGWQLAHGDWEANKRFPAGMKAMAEKILATGRIPGIWLAPFMVSPSSQLLRDHPDWLLRDQSGSAIRAGVTWSGNPFGLDSSHPEVLDWLGRLIHKIWGWGYGYLKLDFLYIGALIGKRYHDIPREVAYRNAMQVIREAAGDAYILACGAPIIPSLGLCDGIRVGPDVAPFWINTPLTIWLNNPNDTSTQNAIRTSIHRLWLNPLVNVDPDVMFFRSRYNALEPHEQQLLQDLGRISGFKATSDLPGWLNALEMKALRTFLESAPAIEQRERYRYRIDGRSVDFNPAVPIPTSKANIPVWLAKCLGLLKVGLYQALPAIWESRMTPQVSKDFRVQKG